MPGLQQALGCLRTPASHSPALKCNDALLVSTLHPTLSPTTLPTSYANIPPSSRIRSAGFDPKAALQEIRDMVRRKQMDPLLQVVAAMRAVAPLSCSSSCP